jgi:hypothetical protein
MTNEAISRGKAGWRSTVAPAATVVLLVAGLAGHALALPAPEELAPGTVARVSGLSPRKGTITVAELRRELFRIVPRDRGTVPEPGTPDYERFAAKAVDSLLETAWIQGEAAERGIAVTRREVSRTVALVKQQSFKSAAEFHRFLRESHLTPHDVYERVELQLLSLRLQRRIVGRIEREARNPHEEQQALKEFVAEFNEKWRARTVCAPRYATERCSNGPPP